MITEVAPTPPPYFFGIILKTRTAVEKLKGLSNETSKQNKPTIIDVKMFNWRIHGVKFSELNKNSTISEYRRQLQNGYETCQVRIDEIMLFTGADYRVFCNNFLTDFDWLAGKGGYSSDYSPVDENGQTLSHEKLFGGAYPDVGVQRVLGTKESLKSSLSFY